MERCAKNKKKPRLDRASIVRDGRLTRRAQWVGATLARSLLKGYRKREFIFRNSDMENAIQIVDSEIETVQGELAKAAGTKQREPNR